MKRSPLARHQFALLSTLLIVACIYLAIAPLPTKSRVWAREGDDELRAGEARGFVIYEENGAMHCRTAQAESDQQLLRPSHKQNLRVIYEGRRPNLSNLNAAAAPEQTGLKIILRSTTQLDGFPEAKAAFIRAAQKWESLIQDSITVVIGRGFWPATLRDSLSK